MWLEGEGLPSRIAPFGLLNIAHLSIIALARSMLLIQCTTSALNEHLFSTQGSIEIIHRPYYFVIKVRERVIRPVDAVLELLRRGVWTGSRPSQLAQACRLLNR